jgi:predicted nucleic acid-binding protein
MLELGLPLGVSALGRLEFRTAILQRVGREIDSLDLSSAAEIQRAFEKCFADGEFILLGVADDAVWKAADGVASRHTATMKLRALDAWHLGYALVCGAKKVCTFDNRMRRAAEAEGLELIP